MHYKLGQGYVTNWGSFILLQIRQMLLQIWAPSILQFGTSVVKDWGSYFRLRQPLLQNRDAFTN